MKTEFVIQDPDHDPHGYAKDDPIEGWIFTILLAAATRFSSFAEARKVADAHYNPGRKTRVRIIEARLCEGP
jgi:hypothetical protein